MMAKRYALLGFGAIGRSIAAAWPAGGGALVAVCVRPHQVEDAERVLGSDTRVVTDIAALLAAEPDVVIEAAGQGAARAHGASILGRGTDLFVMSVGALADRDTETALAAAAATTGARVFVSSGSLAGLDGLRAMQVTGLTDVLYTSRKPPSAWAGTPAEQVCDLARLARPTDIFVGSARDAALAFPRNANLAAAVALAGLGFDRTRVRLIADPGIAANINAIAARAPFNDLTLEMQGIAFAENGKSAMLAGMSIVAALRNGQSSIAFI